MKKILIILLLALPLKSYAQDINIDASVDRREVSLNNSFRIDVTVSGNVKSISGIDAPKLKNFRVVSSGKSHRVSIINGDVKSNYTYSYTLYPRKPGKFKIPPFKLQHEGVIYKAEPIEVTVTKEKSKVIDKKNSSASRATSDKADIFVEQFLQKENAFVGEEVIYTFRLYRRINFLRNPSFQPPSFNGFITNELPPNRNYRKNIDGLEYAVTELKFSIAPIKSGTITVEPAELIVTVKDVSSGNSLFDNFFSSGKKKVLRTEPVNLAVKPLPEEGRPSDFSGAVGKFDIDTRLNKSSCKQGEGITLITTIEGEGNPAPIEKPRFSGLTNFKVYETVSSLNLNKSNYKLTGSKEFRTLIIPQVSGRININPVKFSYFNPDTQKYVTEKSRGLSLNVTPSSKSSDSGDKEFNTDKLRVDREDIRFIKNNLGEEDKSLLYKNKLFKIIAGLPVYLWGAFLIFALFHRKIILPRKSTIKKKKELRKKKKEARMNLKENNLNGVYKNIVQLDEIAGGVKGAEDIVERARKNVYSPEKEGAPRIKKDLKKFFKLLKKSAWIVVLLLFAGAGMLNAEVKGDAGYIELFARANKLYENGDYQKAADIYSRIMKEIKSEGIYYNLGNAYWRMGNIGKARLYWEKAYRVNPEDKDITHNIELIKKIIDEKESQGSLFKLSRKIVSLNGLTLLTVLFGWVFLIALLLYFIYKRESYLWIASAGMVIFLTSFFFLFFRIKTEEEMKKAVVIKTAKGYSSPESNSASQATLPEGLKVDIIRESDNWYEIGVSQNNMKVWINEDNLSEIN